jgi:hypothetical protein
MKTKPQPPDAARDASVAHLRPIFDGLGGNYGAKTKLLQLLNEQPGPKISRHQIARWLCNDPAMRVEPHLGYGLLLRKVFDRHRKTICRPQPLRYWNRRPEKAEQPTTKPTKK